ncbi:universal stress protein [Hydrogenophaga laconesensis]|uniref:universal stress protein n=1 Tax=Hydrogenophaga laconesensis TaxID=1805971 RepID=UPI0035B55AA5
MATYPGGRRVAAVRAAPVHSLPARAILVAAAKISADRVVAGHHGQCTAADQGLGSMTPKVIYAALSDVLVVR